MTVEATLPVQVEEVGKVDAKTSPSATKPLPPSAPPSLLTPNAPTDAQVKNAHGHNVQELVKEMHGERAMWESHPVLASSPLWAGKLLARVHGSTIARLIASVGNDPYLAYNRDAWAALDHLLHGNREAAQTIIKKKPELAKKLGKLLAKLGDKPQTVAAVLLRGHAASTAKSQTTTRAPLQMLMDHVKEQARATMPRLSDTPKSARRVVLQRSNTLQAKVTTSQTAHATTRGATTGPLTTPSPVRAYLIAQRAAYVALAHARLAKDEVAKYRTVKQRRLIKKVKRKGDAHPRTRRDGSEAAHEQH